MKHTQTGSWGSLARLKIALLFIFSSSCLFAEERHGLSIFGKLKYPPNFKNFDYVNPEAPKGGKVSQIGPGGRLTFDSFNPFILKGDPAQGLELLFDPLMVRAYDEPDAVYGLIAKSVDVAADGKSVLFDLHRDAKFADGSPLTAEDVMFSFVTLQQKGHPTYRLALRDVEKAEVVNPYLIKFTFRGDLVRSLPVELAQFPVFSKAYFNIHNFEETSLDKPLGSGPYVLGEFSQGKFVSYKRREDYWAKDLPVNKGRYNFDEIRYDYFRDRTLELEALFSNTIDFREEFTSKDWATGYNNVLVQEGKIQRLSLPDETPSGAQGFFINVRRPFFHDVKVRKALDLAFDFEWTNRNLFYGHYQRTTSFFENSDMKASGSPSSEELSLLEPFKDKLSQDVFEEAYVPPMTDGSGASRENLRKASLLFSEAGWKLDLTDKKLKNKKGEPFFFEILLDSAAFERIAGPYIKNLKSLGIDVVLRRVDPAQFELRMKSFDFDMTVQRYSLRLTPGIELKNFWGSEAAITEGSYNLAGISDPVVDQLIEHVIKAKTRSELVNATRALDRVLRVGHYWVPHWFKASHNLAFWNKYSWPALKPKYDRGALLNWWYDAEKSKILSSD